MGRLILDTSAVIALERTQVAPGGLVAADDEAAISAITVAEVLAGIDGGAASKRDVRLTSFQTLLGLVDVEVYDTSVARAHAALLVHCRRAGRPRGDHDLIIAATARARGATVVTFDKKGFDDLPGVAVRTPQG